MPTRCSGTGPGAMAGDATQHDLIDVVVRLPRATIEQSLRTKSDETEGQLEIDYPSLASAVLASRYHRRELFGGIRFGEPCWDMILELYVSTQHGRTVNVTKLCAASGKSTTTGLRHLEELEARGYVVRTADNTDTRSTMVVMQQSLRHAVEAWLDHLTYLSGGLKR